VDKTIKCGQDSDKSDAIIKVTLNDPPIFWNFNISTPISVVLSTWQKVV